MAPKTAPIRSYDVKSVYQFKNRTLLVSLPEDTSNPLYTIRVVSLYSSKKQTLRIYDGSVGDEVSDDAIPLGGVNCDKSSYPCEVIMGNPGSEKAVTLPLVHKFSWTKTMYSASVPLEDSEKQVQLRWKNTKQTEGWRTKVSIGLHFKLVDEDNRLLARFVHGLGCWDIAGKLEIYEDLNVKDWDLFALTTLLGAVDHASRMMYLASYFAAVS